MEVFEDVVIVGAGIAGLTTALGLHRLGIRSIVLESSDSLRVTGFAFTTWTNAWRAMDAVGIGDSIRQRHAQLRGIMTTSTISGLPTSYMSHDAGGTHGRQEVRCVNRKVLLETLEKDLPRDTIKYSSKLVSIEESGYFKLVHLADGSILKTKVLIGCDGVNSVVAKWLGFKRPAFARRTAIRGFVDLESGHDLEFEFFQLFGDGNRSGFLPADDRSVYWFFIFNSPKQDKELEENKANMKQFVLSKLGKAPDKIKAVLENTEPDNIISSPIRYRPPWEVLWGNISKGNVCVAGDALHPMTPDIGQGGCAALEDGVVLARCLAKVLVKKPGKETKGKAEEDKEQYERIRMGLKKYAKERRWRGFELIATAYMVGFFQQSEGKIMTFFRDKVLATFLAGMLLKRADFDCGKLNIS